MPQDELTPEQFSAGAPQDDDAAPDQGQRTSAPPELSVEEFTRTGPPAEMTADDWLASPGTNTPSGVIGRGVEQGVLPGYGGLVGAVGGARAGAALGGLAGPVGAGVGGFVGGVAGALGAGYLVQKGQDWVLDSLGLGDSLGLSKAQRQTDEAQNPYLSMAAKIAPSLPALSPVGTAGARIAGAAIGGGIEAGSEYAQEGHVDPIKAAMAAGTGALFPNLRGHGEPNTAQGGTEPPRGTPQVNGPAPDGTPGRPFDGEVLPPDTPELQYQNTGKYADKINATLKARDNFDPTDPAWKFWNDHVIELQSREDGKGGVDVDASLGPHSDDNPFTYQMSDRANDLTTVAAGVAHENAPAPQVEGAGNPVGAPMEGRVAQRPSGPLRDYRKLPSPAPPDAEPNPGNTKLSTSVVKDDIAAALGAREQPKVPQDQASAALTDDPVARVKAIMEKNPNAGQEALAKANARKPMPAEDGFRDNPEPQPGVTDAVTLKPHEQRVIDHAMQMLQEAGMDKAIERVKALAPKDQAIAATKLITAMQSKTGEATGGEITEARMPTKRPEVAGLKVQARDKADAARKQGVLDAHEAAYQKHVPGENETSGQMLDRARAMVADTDKATGGDTYKPRVRPASMQLIRQARDLLRKPNPENIEKFRQAEALLRGDKPTLGEVQKSLDQETDALDGEIKNKPQYEDAHGEVAAAKAAPSTKNERPEYEHFDNSAGKEAGFWKTQHSDLVHWLNNLSDESHAWLAKKYDLAEELISPADPKALHDELSEELSDWQKTHLPDMGFDAVPAENAPVVKRTRVVTRDDLSETEPGAPASKGRVIDKSSDEFKKLAAQYGGVKPKEKPAFELENNGIDAARDTRTANDTEKSLFDRAAGEEAAMKADDETLFRRFMADESGAVPLDRFLREASDWMIDRAKGVKNFFTSTVPDHILDYGKQIGAYGTKLRTDISRAANEARLNAKASMADRITPEESSRIYRAAERGQTDQLPPRLRDHFDRYWKPVIDKAGQAYDELRDISIRNKFPHYEKMLERTGDNLREWLPKRMLLDQVRDEYDPITNSGSSLSNWAASAQERDWFELHNLDTGDRRVYRVNEDGNMVFYKNHQASRAKAPPGSFNPREVGADMMVGNSRMRVSHADVDALMQHGNGMDGKPLKFSTNIGYTVSDAYIGLKSALHRAKTLDAILTDPEFRNMSAFSDQKADQLFGKGNWAESILPQMKGRRMPKPVAWAFDDLVKTGFNYNNRALEHLSRFAQATLKPFYFLGPEVHVFNELDKFITMHGLGLPQAVMAFGKAIKSVRSQDAVQREILDAGGNPMFMHAATSNTMGQIAKMVGEEAAIKKWKWDPLAKAFGPQYGAKELSEAAYRNSNKMMWWQSDVLYTASYMRFRNSGMSPHEAVKATEKVIDSYVIPTTVGKTFGVREGSDLGRILQKVGADPLASLFFRYHYGVVKSVGSMVKNIIGANGVKNVPQGMAQAALMAGMYYYLYPLMSAGYQKLTGDASSEVEKRGATRLISTALDVASGKKHDDNLLRNVYTPSTVLDFANQTRTNTNFSGKAIRNLPWDNIPDAASNIGRTLEHAAQTFVSPYGAASRAAQTPGGHPGRAFLESNFGVKTKTPGAEKFDATQFKRDNATRKANIKRPMGYGDELTGKMFR